MFTGLVQAVGIIVAVKPTAAGVRLSVNLGGWTHRPKLGDSISTSGVCLTVAAMSKAKGGRIVAFDAVPETLAKTNLGRLKPGDRVNLEHSVTASTLMGGHFVQGHVDGVARIRSINTKGEWRVRLSLPQAITPFVAPKGSICLDGVSLTIAALRPKTREIEVALIPTTLELTTLGAWHVGDEVNVEADMLAKTVVNFLKQYGKGTRVAK